MKAILVIDMPHCCHDCICADWDQCLCKASNREIYSQEYMNGGRQDWCPLKPLPERWIPQLNGLSTEQQIRNIDFAGGWNRCLERIEK